MTFTTTVYNNILGYINGIVCPDKPAECKPDDLSKVPTLKLSISSYAAITEDAQNTQSSRFLQASTPAEVAISPGNYVYQKEDKTLALAASIVADGTSIPGCGAVTFALNDAFYVQFPVSIGSLEGKRTVAFGGKPHITPGSDTGSVSEGLSTWIIPLIIIFIIIVVVLLIGGSIFYFFKMGGGNDDDYDHEQIM